MILQHWEPWVSVSDVHGDQQDKTAVAAFFEFCTRWKPKYRILNGDLFDFRPLRKKCDAEERRESIIADFTKGVNFFNRFKPTTFLLGNHDARLYHLAESDRGLESDFAQQGVQEIQAVCDHIKCRLLPYDKRKGVLLQGDLKFAHGFAAGTTAPRRMASAYGRIVFGHTHALEHTRVESHDIREAWNQGCLCSLDPEYSSATIGALRWQHGWCYGVYHPKTGRNLVWLAQKTGNQWILPTGLESL